MTLRTALAAAALCLALLAGSALAAISRSSHREPAARAQACVLPAPGTHRVAVATGRVPIVLHAPPGTPPAAGRPLILVLGGAGQTASDIARYTGYSRLADAKGFLVAYPTATGARPFWNVSGTVAGKPDDVAYLRQAITTLVAAGCADPRRVGVTGVSNGGGMAARLACDAADLLAAAAPVAGGYSTLPDCRPRRPLSILEIHGLRDGVVPYAGRPPNAAGAVGPWLDAWRDRDECTSPGVASAPARNVSERRWSCPDGRMVVHDVVADAEHGWPGESSLAAPFSSTVRTWRFLTSFADEAQAARRR